MLKFNVNRSESSEHTHFFKEINTGKIIPYDGASKTLDFYDPKFFKFVGCGSIYKIHGVLQNETEISYFFQHLH
jgi:hypothetical protein